MSAEEITFDCPHCEVELSARADVLGLEIECPECGGLVEVTAPPGQVRSSLDVQGLMLAVLVGALGIGVFNCVRVESKIEAAKKRTPPIQAKAAPAAVQSRTSRADAERLVAALDRAKQVDGCKVEYLKVYSERGWTYATGKIRNNGDAPVRFLRVFVEWLDGGGTVIGADSTYAIPESYLAPGDARLFKLMVRENPHMEKYRYWLGD